MDNSPMIELRSVTKDYPFGGARVVALDNVSLKVAAGEFVAISGPSGSGKSTMLNLAGCVDVPTRGEVLIDGESIGNLSSRKLTNFRLHRLGFIFQSFNLLPVLSVFENVEVPLLLQGGVAGSERRRRVEAVLDQVGLGGYGRRRPSELSGGQCQRVAIARALVGKPKLIVADEPTASLDSKTAQQVIELLGELNRKSGATLVFSTHDSSIMSKASRVVALKDGRLETSA